MTANPVAHSSNSPAINTDDIDNAIAVLNQEAQALLSLSSSIGEPFSQAVSIIHEMKEQDAGSRGRLIVAGIGKSGHVARKIAATLASTGTPSYFVHPGEASHGDMGMVTEADIVLLLSNSGENAELSDLIHYTRRFSIPLIAITSKSESSLGRHSDICLTLPPADEACPNGLAPTTSTTMMMALGDALAVALLKRMGLTSEQYKVFHPGGKLGQRLMSIAELMVPKSDLPLLDGTALMDLAIVEMAEKNLGAVLIMKDENTLAGIITDGDLKRVMAPDLLQKKATDIMSENPKTVRDDLLAVEALNIMTKTPGKYLTSLIVVDKDQNLTGMIRLQDCLKAGLV